jgi:hypothetical protein
MVHRKGKRVQTLATRFIARFNRCWLAEATADDHVKERRHGGFNCSELVKETRIRCLMTHWYFNGLLSGDVIIDWQCPFGLVRDTAN